MLSCIGDLYLSSWQGEGQDEKGIEKATGKVRIEVDPKYYRPTEVVSLVLLMIASFPSLSMLPPEKCEGLIFTESCV